MEQPNLTKTKKSLLSGIRKAIKTSLFLFFFGLLISFLTSVKAPVDAAVGNPPTLGLPYATGTTGVSMGVSGLHAGNFSAVPGYSYVLNGYSSVTNASLDIGFVGQSSTSVHAVALANGTVLIGYGNSCNMVLIDYGDAGNGYHLWGEYIHMGSIPSTLTTGSSVTAGQTLGTPTTNYVCGESGTSNFVHTHFAFLYGSGTTGTYQDMTSTVLCGHTVLSNSSAPNHGGTIDNLQSLTSAFTIPSCPSNPVISISNMNVTHEFMTDTAASVSYTVNNTGGSTFGVQALNVIFTSPNGSSFAGVAQNVSNLPVNSSVNFSETLPNFAHECGTCYAGTYTAQAEYLDGSGNWRLFTVSGNSTTFIVDGTVVMTNGVNTPSGGVMTDTSVSFSYTIENKDSSTFGYNALKLVFMTPSGRQFDSPVQNVSNLATGAYQTYSQNIPNFANWCTDCYAGTYAATAEYLDPWGTWHNIVGPGNPVNFSVWGTVVTDPNGVITPSGGVMTDTSVNFSFNIENKDSSTFGYNALKLVFTTPSGRQFDSPVQNVSNLATGAYQLYSQNIPNFANWCTDCYAGTYTAQAMYLDPWGTWHNIVGPGNLVSFSVWGTVVMDPNGLIVPSSISRGGNATTSFNIENKDSSTFGYNALRVEFVGPNGATFEAPTQNVSNLPTGSFQSYSQSITNFGSGCSVSTCTSGTYTATAEFLDPWGTWHTIIGPGNPVTITVN